MCTILIWWLTEPHFGSPVVLLHNLSLSISVFLEQIEFCNHPLSTTDTEDSTVFCPLPGCVEFLALIPFQMLALPVHGIMLVYFQFLIFDNSMYLIL